MRDHDGRLTFAPRLPARLERLAFRLVFRGRRLKVEVVDGAAEYTLLDGEPLEIGHHGRLVTVSPDAPLRLPVPPVPLRAEPTQPPGRAPLRRSVDVFAAAPPGHRSASA
jgi:alpha,alpha-trehalose phosphorylase